MIRFGIICDIDAAKGLARVDFIEDGIVSDWLPIIVPKGLGDSFSWMLDINEQVACLMDKHAEDGVILGAIYSNANQPNGGNKDKFRVVFSDDTVIEYDRAAHKLTADVKGAVEVKATGDVDVETATNATVKAVLVTLDAPNVTCTGILTAAQIATAPGTGGTGALEIDGDITVTGNVTADGDVEGTDVKAGIISLLTHKHTGVSTGGGTSGTPVP